MVQAEKGWGNMRPLPREIRKLRPTSKQKQIVKMGGVPGIHKICSRCGLMKEKNIDFHKNAAHHGYQNECRECRRQNPSERKLENIEKKMIRLTKEMNYLYDCIQKL